MTLRNFWISANIDGRNTELKGGPKSKNGGLILNFLMREKGTKATVLTVNAYEENGQLYFHAFATHPITGETTTIKFMTER